MSDTLVEKIEDFRVVIPTPEFTVGPVEYRGELVDVVWSGNLLDSGNYRTQRGWVGVLEGSEWMLPDGPLYYATLSALFNNRDGFHAENVERMRQVFAGDFREHRMMTGTGIVYGVDGLDRVVHGVGTPEAVTIETNLVGPGGCVNPGMEGVVEALLGTDDVDEVNDVYEWVSGKSPYVWRFNSSPSQDVGRALVLGRVDGRFDIYFNYYDLGASRGVRVSAARDSTGNQG